MHKNELSNNAGTLVQLRLIWFSEPDLLIVTVIGLNDQFNLQLIGFLYS